MTTQTLNRALLVHGLLLLTVGVAIAISVGPQFANFGTDTAGVAYNSVVTASWELSGAAQTGAFSGALPDTSALVSQTLPAQAIGLSIAALLALMGGFGMTACALGKRSRSCM